MKKHLLLFSLLAFYSLSQAQTVTWSHDIAPILYANCTKCHNPNGAGHFSLLTFADAYNEGFNMESATAAGIMPPWPPNENYKHFAHERVLAQADIDKISQWVADGRPEGDITLAPAQPTYSTGSVLGTVDLTVRIPTYTVGANNDVYRNFPITTTVPAGSYITAMEVVPGNSHIVHHVLIFQDSTNVPAQLDANQTGPGYTNAGGTGSVASKLIGGYTPGASPYYTPVGTGFRLAANTNIVVQVHYPAGSQGLVDSTRINFKITSVPQREITVWPLVNHLQNMTNGPINIPANTTKTYYEQYNVSGNYTFLSAFPHMHLVGTTIKSWANKTTTPFDTIRFEDVPNWDFHWQDTYVFPNAVKVPSGYKIQAVATYDNTSNNPNNPNVPPQTVTAGEATTDEMMLVFFGYMPYVNGDENLIIDRRVIPQGATTFCTGQSVVLKTIEGTGYTYQWYRNGVAVNGATTLSYTATQSGNYHVQIFLGPNNSLSDTIAVNVNASPAATITPAGSTSLCPGSSVTLNANAGSGYSYQWLKDGTPIANAISSAYNTSGAGSYTVQVYNGCYASATAVAVTSVSAPSSAVSPSGPTTFCQGGSVALTAPAGLTYHWSNNSTTQTINVNQTGSYIVTVTDGNNCSAVSTSTSVTVNSLPSSTVTAGGPTTFCQGGNVTLSAPAGLTYNWSNSANTQTITANQSGSYTVTVTNSNNCSAISSVTSVMVNPPPAVSITPGGATSFCPGGSVTLAANTGSNYHWSNSASSQTITVSQTGNYILTLTDANNCSNTATMAVTVYSTPDASVTTNQPTTICPGDSVILSAQAGLIYNWSSGASTQSITVLTNGNFTLTVTDSHSCTAISIPVTVTISNSAVAGITPSGATTFCEGGSVQLTASNGAAYQWSNNETTASITVSSGGSFTVTVTESGSCTAVSNPVAITVNQNPPVPVIMPGGPTTFCAGGSLDLNAPAGYSYVWSSNETTQSVTVTQTGNFTYALTVSDANGCSAISNHVTVTVNALPVVTLTGNADAVCSNAPTYTLMGQSPAGGTFLGPGVTGSSFDPAAVGTGVQTVIYTYTDNNGCPNSASETIDVTICSGITGITNYSFTVTPNPSDGNFEMEWTGKQTENAALNIFDISGKLIYAAVIEKTKTKIAMGNVPSGCYLLQVKTERETLHRKLIVQF